MEEELLAYVEILKEIVDQHYEKEMIFYDSGEWYSRYHSRQISIDELKEWVLEITYIDYEQFKLKRGENMRVYFAHPYGTYGEREENIQNVEQLIKKAYHEHHNIIPISPIHALGFMYDEVNYQTGIELCFNLLQDADLLVLCGEWEKSKGANLELQFAIKNQIPVVLYENLDQYLK